MIFTTKEKNSDKFKHNPANKEKASAYKTSYALKYLHSSVFVCVMGEEECHEGSQAGFTQW